MYMRCKACNELLDDDVQDEKYELCNECYGYVLEDLNDDLNNE